MRTYLLKEANVLFKKIILPNYHLS